MRVRDTDAEISTLQSIPEVREYTDVSPDELPRIPRERDMEFSIDLLPRTQPISIPPYSMAPAELKESLIEWLDVGKSGIQGPDLIQQAIEKCIGDPTQVVPVDDAHITEDLSYEEVLVAILDREIRKLRNKEVALVKVL
uniref:Uncharacterized protein n=1 Tax=Nicotiana tabacum TaxID=4097 RepID=A0A1S4A184_TOBAC|nr:PREDICTED: uncharacterized protein LOC107792637 [Nicotiana tabacum]